MSWKFKTIALALVLAVDSGLSAQVTSSDSAPPSCPLRGFGIMPRPAFKRAFIQLPGVQEELKVTTAQLNEIKAANAQRSVKLEKARREIKNDNKLEAAAQAIWDEWLAAALKSLEPKQRDRLDQIQLQAQGPLAFEGLSNPDFALEEPSMAVRLKLSDDQIARVGKIAEEGIVKIVDVASVPIVLDPKAGAPTLDSIRQLVETAEFQGAKRKAMDNVREAWKSAIQGIEQVLTEPQRKAYREMRGEPFDISKFRSHLDERAEDAEMVANALNIGGGGGQRSDPDFDTKVARPAYVAEHPRVLFDEAHYNFHTTDGRYKPFADLIAHDGYKIIPNKEKFNQELLAKGAILIIANALGDDGMGAPGASNSAFTEPECDAVAKWVRAGGSLLLITDHAPFGAAAESLAKRFGVEMSKGYTSDPTNSEGGDTRLIFSRENKLLGDHPITNGRDESEQVRRVQTFTGQSLKGPEGSALILKLGETAVDATEEGQTISAAGRAQGLAFAFGEGRVVVLGEAAELSAQMAGTERFGMNVPGIDNRRMAINILHWLSGLLEPRDILLKKAG